MKFEKLKIKEKVLKILTPGIRQSQGGGLFEGIWLFFVVFVTLFLKILAWGIRQSLGGGLLGRYGSFFVTWTP